MTQETNVIHCGDNLGIMKGMESESVNLIYLDPPFFSGRNYDVIWEGVNGNDHSEVRSFKDTEWYRGECPKCGREVIKADRFCPACGTSLENVKVVPKNDIYAYIDWMIPRLTEMHRILKSTGSIYLHCDHHAVHYLKIEMDRIFGMGNFKTQITWRRCHPKGSPKTFANNSDYILYYTKNSECIFNVGYGEYKETTLKMYKYNDNDDKGKYRLVSVNKPDIYGYKYDLGYGENCPGNGYRWTEKTMREKIADGLMVIKPNRVPQQKRYLSESKGVPFDNVWTDVENVKKPMYPTEKPAELLERIILSSSNPGDIVFDPFSGCSTTLVAAKRLGREWIGIDVSPTACSVIADRLNVPTWKIEGMPITTEELHRMDPDIFQQWVCDRMEANNTNTTPEKHGGGDGGIDGIVRANVLTTGFEGAFVQVKRTKNVGVNTVKALYATITDPDNEDGTTNGFVVALSFGKGAIDKAASYNNAGKVNITLVKAENIAEKGYFDIGGK